MILRSTITLCWIFCVVLVTSMAGAEPTEEEENQGKELAGEAMGHYNEGEFEAALEKFRSAEDVYPAAQVLRMKGYSLMALENWLEAAEAIEQAIASQYRPLVPRDAEHAEDQLKKVLSHLAVVEMRSNAPGATVTIDGQESRDLPASVRLLPGSHRFVVEAPDHLPLEQERDLEEGEHSLGFDLEIVEEGVVEPEPMDKPEPEPEPEPDEPSDPYGWFAGQGVVGLVTAGVGAAVGGVGLGLGLYGTSLRGAVQENIDVHNQSYDPACNQHSELCRRDIDLINRDGVRARDLQNTGMVMGITGGALFVVGTVLFIMSDESPLAGDEPDVASGLRCGGGADGTSFGLSCHGAF